MSQKSIVLRVMAFVVWGVSIATVVLSIYSANATGYNYDPVVSSRTYNGILVGSAFALAIIILASVLTIYRIDSDSQQLLRTVSVALGMGAFPVRPEELDTILKEEVKWSPNSPRTQRVKRTLGEYWKLQDFRRNLRALVAAPVGLLSAIFAISSWALPAETFLRSVAVLNTTLLFFITYGMVVAVASVIIAALAMLTWGRVAPTG